MSHTIKATVETENKAINPSEPMKITVEVDCLQFDNVDEANEWYGGEEKVLEAINQDAKRRQTNAVRPPLRESETVLDWAIVGQRAVDAYRPGRKGGFQQVTAEEEKLEDLMATGDLDAVKQYLIESGMNLT